MYLKSLHVQGFKSFCDKTIINMSDGLTAVVGPNGSGKSNVSDAVRWVLGEQSNKTLRSSKMEDIIFAGTQTRGSVGFAQVSLIFDNTTSIFKSEYNEIMITRRYYRSGESEFYINKKAVRLKDIHELLMDTGLGRDGYSIIGQGRIDEILGAKSQDRREVFEEAAGITKYKYKKEESIKKLAGTEENLIRVRDIIQTLASQINPLETAAQKAKIYLKLYDEMKTLDIAISSEKLTEFHTKMIEITDTINQSQASLIQEEQTRISSYKNAENISQDIRDIDVQIDNYRKNMRDIVDDISQFTSQIAVLDEKTRANTENISRINNDQDNIEKRFLEIDLSIQNAISEKCNYEISNEKCTQEISQLNQEISCVLEKNTDKKLLIDEKRSKHDAQTQKLSDISIKIAKTQSRLENLNSLGEFAALPELLDAKNSVDDLKNQLLLSNQDETSTKNSLDGLMLKIDTRHDLSNSLNNEIITLEKETNTDISKLKILQDMQKDFSGFGSAIKFIMSKNITGVLGPLSSLIKTDYPLACDTALAGFASNIVCENSDIAKNCINILKAANAGRATFLPIDTIKPAFFREKSALLENGVVDIASNLVISDFGDIISNVLGKILIVDNIDNALLISKKYNASFKIVTLDGMQINAGGSLTGGSASRTSGVLSRQNSIDTLQNKISKDSILLENLKSKHKIALENYEKLKYDIDTLKNHQNNAKHNSEKISASLNLQSKFLQNLQAQYDDYQNDKQNLQTLKTTLTHEIAALVVQKDEISSICDNISCDIANILNEIQNTDENINKLNSIKTQQITININIENSKKNIADLEKYKNDILSDKTEKSATIDNFIAENENINAQKIKYTQQISDFTIKKENIQISIDKSIENRHKLEKNKTIQEKQAQITGDNILSLERMLSKYQTQKTGTELENKQILDRLWENYELTPSNLNPQTDILNSDSEKDLASLKSKIKALGNVNTDAIDQYTETKEKFDFLTRQKDDIENARDDILKTIDDLTQNMKHTFKTQFDILNKKFSETFIDIFGGGNASLILEDEKNILSCGIEIACTLPGKKIKTISLLSGGEKAFVAIALYFAILSVRPTPFCILDEIDAALDDINVLRFAKYIKKMSLNTQFMVITHRRGTMESADMLVGVTMPNAGVSRIVVLSTKEDGYEFVG